MLTKLSWSRLFTTRSAEDTSYVGPWLAIATLFDPASVAPSMDKLEEAITTHLSRGRFIYDEATQYGSESGRDLATSSA